VTFTTGDALAGLLQPPTALDEDEVAEVVGVGAAAGVPPGVDTPLG
jgi:hypothetical protein